MTNRLTYTDIDFSSRLADILTHSRDSVENVSESVRDILNSVKNQGDAALIELSNKFDRLNAKTAQDLCINKEDLKAAFDATPPHIKAALQTAADRIKDFHARQQPKEKMALDYIDETGTRLGQFWTAIDAVGLYVPGGLASYPSSVLMNAIPAKVAGVERLVMTVPTPDGVINPLVLAAAHLVGIDEIYSIGGAQAVGALSFGTETIKPVDKIVGPGNAYVAEAKRQVFGIVGIDTIAGPSEILVIADQDNDPKWIATDLLSQAEHDPVAQAILITPDADFADAVCTEIDALLETLERGEIAGTSWKNNGCVIISKDLSHAASLSNQFAPEHLELAVADPDSLMQDIKHAGAVFLGRYTPEAIGDYIAGPNHVLPTSRSARFSSGLSVYDFMKRTTFVGCTKDSIQAIGPAAVSLAKEESLQAHGLSVSIRL